MSNFSRFASMRKSFERKCILHDNRIEYTDRGAFKTDSSVRFEVKVPVNSETVSMILQNDETGEIVSYDMASDSGVFTITLNMSRLSETGGLFFYKYRIHTSNGDFEIVENENTLEQMVVDASGGFGNAMQLLIYKPYVNYPMWMLGGIMYQIFPDRFYRGGDCPCRDDIVIQKENEMPYVPDKNEVVLNNNFFRGDLYGVEQKLDYLLSLGVNIIYLNPIFKAYSNHKYDTADYFCVDEMFGGELALRHLIDSAEERGMHIILDGVFNHTGSDSVYFNNYGKYDSVGAYQSKESPYYEWYNFTSFPDKYESWWGIDTLPRVKCDNPSYKEFICGTNGVIQHYIKKGISGWRLDVADELSDDFIRSIKKSAVEVNKNSVIIGEVWEDASNKIAYDKRRKYFQGEELDSVMNYPIRTAIIAFLKHGNAEFFVKTLREIYGHYPPENANLLMNLLGTHDTERIITVLAGESSRGKKKRELLKKTLSEEEKKNGISLVRLAYTIISTLPGVPCIYYGDEAGLEGYGDPLCRRFFPWGNENEEILSFVKRMGEVRRSTSVFSEGEFAIRFVDHHVACYERICDDYAVAVVLNRSDKEMLFESHGAQELIFGKCGTKIAIPPLSSGLFKIDKEQDYAVTSAI